MLSAALCACSQGQTPAVTEAVTTEATTLPPETKALIDTEAALTEALQTTGMAVLDGDIALTQQVVVRGGYLDGNGHMNNVKYLDWMADLLPSQFHGENPPVSISLCYVNEAWEGEELSMNWTHGADNVLRVEATDSAGGKRIFGAEMVCG